MGWKPARTGDSILSPPSLCAPPTEAAHTVWGSNQVQPELPSESEPELPSESELSASVRASPTSRAGGRGGGRRNSHRGLSALG